MAKFSWLKLLSCLLLLHVTEVLGDDLPIVDLGYRLQQASSFNVSVPLARKMTMKIPAKVIEGRHPSLAVNCPNETRYVLQKATGQYFNFSGIRYASPPIGDLRWRAPVAPPVERTIHDGSDANICPQARPAWTMLRTESELPWFVEWFNKAKHKVKVTKAQMAELNTTSSPVYNPLLPPAVSEDCLFLDVAVPSAIFNNRAQALAPVLVWIYGGGYTAGYTNSVGSAAGLIGRSVSNGGGVVYVAFNYRLGALGWLGGPTLQTDGVANAALYDQRFALQWVRQYIHLFGGDPNQVTVMGESAGAGSIMHQITAYGGFFGPEEVPFQKAILQSPAFIHRFSPSELDAQLLQLLELTNTTSLDELRQVPTETLITANYRVVYLSPWSSYTYGPSIDGSFVPDVPGKLLAEGAFDAQNVQVMVGHNTREGLAFVDPFVKRSRRFPNYMHLNFPQAASAVVDYISNTLYPPAPNKVLGYPGQIARSAKALGEVGFNCNTFYIDKAYGNLTYSYIFDGGFGLHGEDVPFTFYNGKTSTTLPGDEVIAYALQDYITTFARTGVPTAVGVEAPFNIYGPAANVQFLSSDFIGPSVDDAANERCNWWQEALYL